MNVFTCRPPALGVGGVGARLATRPARGWPAASWSRPKVNTLPVLSVRVTDQLRFAARPRVSSGYLATGRSRR